MLRAHFVYVKVQEDFKNIKKMQKIAVVILAMSFQM